MVCPVCGETAKWQWTSETHVSTPNAYAMSKYFQEMQALTFGLRYGIPSVALRYSIVQGPRQSFYNVYSGACRIFSLNYYFEKAPTIYEDGLQCRDFVNIHDVVKANILALNDDRMNYGIFNVGGGYPYTVSEFAQMVKREFQKRKSNELPEPVVPGYYRFGDTRNACSNISKIKALGWKPQYSPEHSVEEYVNWLYEQEDVEDILEYAENTMKDMGVVRSAY
jgi:dTDP-L-rhamnose 4-epimerase